MTFWDGASWEMIWVDQYFPAFQPGAKSHGGKFKLIFAKSENMKEIWPVRPSSMPSSADRTLAFVFCGVTTIV